MSVGDWLYQLLHDVIEEARGVVSGNPVRRQLVALVDNRTTPCCLAANGQVVEVDEPFRTILGDKWVPPFHVHCRSIVVPWVRGMGAGTAADSRAELRHRTPRERDQARGKTPYRIPGPKSSSGARMTSTPGSVVKVSTLDSGNIVVELDGVRGVIVQHPAGGPMWAADDPRIAQILRAQAKIDPTVEITFSYVEQSGFMWVNPASGLRQVIVGAPDLVTEANVMANMARAAAGGQRFYMMQTGDDWLEYIVSHENGHVLHMLDGGGDLGPAKSVFSALTGEPIEKFGSFADYEAMLKLGPRGLSMYGMVDMREAIAECYAEFVMAGRSLEAVSEVTRALVTAYGWA